LSVSPDAQFIFDITWTRDNADGSPAFDVPTAQIDFEAPSLQGFQDMAFCPDILYVDGVLTGLPEGTNPTQLGTDFVPESQLPGFQFACVSNPRDVQLGASEITVTDKVFLIGDAKMRW
jgi:hypothetical protein